LYLGRGVLSSFTAFRAAISQGRDRLERRELSGMSALVAAIATVLLIAAGALYYTALEQIRPRFPPNLRDAHTARFALNALIWDRLIPDHLRRKYLLSLAFGDLAILSIAIATFLEGLYIWTAFAVSLFLCSAAYTVVQWKKYLSTSKDQ